MPTIIVSSTRKAIMYSRTRVLDRLPARQDADRRQQRWTAARTAREMPSTPMR